MNPTLLMQQHDSKWLAERVCELEAEADATDRAYIDECATNVYLEADNAALKDQLKEHDDYYRKVINEECASDEVHCTCVPALRDRIRQLEKK